ncbi:efflux RND transporter permease subunit [Teredinibacter turnerae]|uniref:efflux RND transporter permease subunit n=1 Tax=Teredinibacter turnerae TaxID=2426 RepID=UPI0003609CAA|nr:MMPL family transporter [Teredinibacter turnerae]
MKSFFYTLPGTISGNRIKFYAVLLIVLAVCFQGMGKLTRDDSIESWLGEDSPVIKQQRELERVFGNNEDMAILVEARDGDVFSAESLAALLRLQETLENYRLRVQDDTETPLNHIQEIVSLVNVPVTDVTGDNLYTHPFIGNFNRTSANVSNPEDASLRARLKRRALTDVDLLRRFVSTDGRIAAFHLKTDFGRLGDASQADTTVDSTLLDNQLLELDLASLEAPVTDSSSETPPPLAKKQNISYKEYSLFSNAVKSLVSEAGVEDQFRIHYAGLPELIAFHVAIGAENKVIFSGLFLLMMAVLLALFRHPSIVLWCMCIPILTVILTFGVQGWSGQPSSDLAAAMSLLLIIIGVADAVHIMAEYRHGRLIGQPHPEAIAQAMSKAGLSCLLTSLTTMVAFLSLYLVKPNIHTAIFGLFTTLGLGVAFVLSVVLLPLLLDIWRPAYKGGRVKEVSDTERATRFYSAVPVWVCRRPVFTLAAFFSVVIPVSAGIYFLKVDSNPLESFDESTYIRQAAEVADHYMGGTQNIDFMVNTGSIDALYDARVLHTIDRLQVRMREHFSDLVLTDNSIVNVLKRINRQFHGDDPDYYVLPESNAELGQLLFLFNTASPEERRKLVSEDFDSAKVMFGLKNGGSTDYIELVNTANLWGAEMFNELKADYPDLEVITAGGVVMFMTLFERIATSQLVSFLITLSVVTLTLLFLFRSLKIGILAMVPNVIPVAVTFGVMGWLGITLNNVTMIIAPIILGIAVDDTIHFINRFRNLLDKSDSVDTALIQTFATVGKAITYTTVILSAGLLTLLYSSNSEFQAFAYLSAIAFSTALAAEFFVTPALLKLFYSKKETVQQYEVHSYEAPAKMAGE